MLKPDELKQLAQVNGGKTWGIILVTWGMIVATFAVAIIWPYWWVILIALCFMARHQLSLALLMHDASHWRLFKLRLLNDYVGQFFFAAPLFFSLGAYRKFHLKHHQNPLVAEDPDISLIGGYPIPTKSLWRKLFRDATGLSYFKFIKYFISRSRTEEFKKTKNRTVTQRKTGLSFNRVLFMILVTNACIFSGLYYFDQPWLYLFLWFMPTFTFLQVLLRIRGITEHAGYEPNKDQRQNARSLVNPFQTFWLAPNNAAYHLEHHAYPSVPWYNLPKVHRLMKERGSIPEKNYYTSYLDVVKELTY